MFAVTPRRAWSGPATTATWCDNAGDGVTESGGAPAYVPPSGYWTVKGTADLNGDGRLDVLIVNAGGEAADTELVQNGAVTSTTVVPFYTNWD